MNAFRLLKILCLLLAPKKELVKTLHCLCVILYSNLFRLRLVSQAFLLMKTCFWQFCWLFWVHFHSTFSNEILRKNEKTSRWPVLIPVISQTINLKFSSFNSFEKHKFVFMFSVVDLSACCPYRWTFQSSRSTETRTSTRQQRSTSQQSSKSHRTTAHI